MYKRLLLILLLVVVSVRWVFAEVNCEGKTDGALFDCLSSQIGELNKSLEMSVAATKPLESEISKLSAKIKQIQFQINEATKKQKQTEIEIKLRGEKVTEQYEILSIKLREMYKRLRSRPMWANLVVNRGLGEIRRELAYRQESNDRDRQVIVNLINEITTLEEDKKKLENQRQQLAKLQTELDKQNNFFLGEVKKAKDYQSDLNSKIAALSAQQQAIIAARSGSFITGVGSVPIGSDYDASIAGFNGGAPSGSFGIFSFGAFTHRKGMSQYGAKARATEGQNYETILESYYGKKPVSKDTGGDIKVAGQGNVNFEEKYLYGIAEMPSDWPMEALKAQAIAARTYAYRYKKDNLEICITEACQVFSKSKADNPPEAWKKAVQETRGKVLEDVVTFYSSTVGGYLTTSGWDTTDKSGNGDWTSRAWESKAGSPWFYKSWYRNGYKNSDDSCGRKPWLSQEEMADILNAWLVLKKGEGGGVDTGRVLPVTINNCKVGGQSGDPYTMADLRSKINNPVTSISGKPVVTHDGSGNTTNVKFVTNRGDLNISGSEFKDVFNTRAPGYVSIPQKGFAFFNIERK